jgi:S-adenosylmethionine synthetase
MVCYDKQSNDIAQGVDHASDDYMNIGAGDQGSCSAMRATRPRS